MSSKACIDDLIEWTSANYVDIPKGDWNFVGEKRLKVLAQGHTCSSNWKRRAKKQHGNLTFRLFECKETLFDLSVMFLVIEEKDNLTATVKLGTREEFEKYFNNTGYNWGGWSK